MKEFIAKYGGYIIGIMLGILEQKIWKLIKKHKKKGVEKNDYNKESLR